MPKPPAKRQPAIPALPFQWDALEGVLRPRYPQRTASHLEDGKLYLMAVQKPRNMDAHRAYFAAVHEAWMNLPEQIAHRFPSSEHLRKWALIHTGYYNEEQMVCDTEEDAKRMGTFIRRMDRFAVITVKGNVISSYTAQSQSHEHMEADEFYKSKQDVLDFIAAKIGIEPQKLLANAGRSA